MASQVGARPNHPHARGLRACGPPLAEPVASVLLLSAGNARCRGPRRCAVRHSLRSRGARGAGAVRVPTGAHLPLASALALFRQLTHVTPLQLLKWRTCALTSAVGAVVPACPARRCGTCMLPSALRRVLLRTVGCWGATRHHGGECRQVWRECMHHSVLRWHVEYNGSVCACAAGRRGSAALGATAPRAAVECILLG
jgi:hypothetical protein